MNLRREIVVAAVVGFVAAIWWHGWPRTADRTSHPSPNPTARDDGGIPSTEDGRVTSVGRDQNGDQPPDHPRKKIPITGVPAQPPAMMARKFTVDYHERGSQYCFIKSSRIAAVVSYLTESPGATILHETAHPTLDAGDLVRTKSWGISANHFQKSLGRCWDSALSDGEYYLFNRIDGVPVEQFESFAQGYQLLLRPGLHELGVATLIRGYDGSGTGLFLQVVGDP